MSAKLTDDNSSHRAMVAEGNADATPGYMISMSVLRRGLCVFMASVAVMTALPAAANAQAAPPPARPFFEANGGDVVAGSDFATDLVSPGLCTDNPPNISSAGIVSWSERKNSNSYLGAGGQYAAMALGYVQDFVSGQGNGRTNDGAEPNDLTFANVNVAGAQNSVDINNGFFGGMFEDAPCADYWSDRPAGITPKPIPAGRSVGNWNSDVYSHTGDLTLSRSELPLEKRVTLYVEGDVAIAEDIYYNTGYTSREQIPQFRLIVKGVIYIRHDVTRLDGLYAAIPDSTAVTDTSATFNKPINGTISTCSIDFKSIVPSEVATNSMASVCNNRLTVTGSFVAHQIWLLRTFGNLNTGVKEPAEVFNYNPEMWLSPSGGGINRGYQSIIGLPPIL